MMLLRQGRTALGSAAVLLAISARPLPAEAQSTGNGPSYHRPVRPELSTWTTTTPNASLIASGMLTLGLPYAASIVAATESSKPADNYLYAPIAGPWLNLANRADCPTGANCGNETAYRALLIADGVLQGVGIVEVISGFLFPVAHSITTIDSVSVRIVPTGGRDGFGLRAVGTF